VVDRRHDAAHHPCHLSGTLRQAEEYPPISSTPSPPGEELPFFLTAPRSLVTLRRS